MTIAIKHFYNKTEKLLVNVNQTNQYKLSLY